MAESEVTIPHVKFTCGPEEEEDDVQDESAPMLTTTQPVEDQGGGDGTGSGPEQGDGVDVLTKLTSPSPHIPVSYFSGYPVVPPCMIRATGRTPMCLQGPRHLFTVVPVASAGTLEKLDEEFTTEEGGDGVGVGEGGDGEGTPLLSAPQEPRVVVTPPPPIASPASSASATGPDRSPRLFNSLSRLMPPPPVVCSSGRSHTSSLHTTPSAPVLMGTAPTAGAMRGYYHRMSPHDPYHTVTALPHSHVRRGVGGGSAGGGSGGGGGGGGGSGNPSPLQTSPYQTVTGSCPLQGIPPSLATIVLPPSQQVRQKGLHTSRSFCSRPRAPHLQYRGVNRVIPGGMSVGVNSEGVGLASSRVGGAGGNVPAATASAANVCPVDWPYGVTIPALHQLTAHSGITSPDQMTIRSLNQLTIRSGGSVTVDVGSTDGRNIKVRGAVVTPEQLFVPYVRHGLVDDDSDDGLDGTGRQTWQNKAQFVLACIGYAVGLGNIWRFPYLCYKSGGGAFMIPYLIMLFLCGIPLLLMEMTVGQYTRRGPIGAMEKMCPFFKGAGVGTVVISFLLGTYYNVIIAWTIFYLFKSFSSSLPWKNCDASWGTNCFDGFGSNVTAPNGTNSPTQEFFNKVVLEMSGGIEEQGMIRWQLVLALLGAWFLVYFSLWKSVKSSGKVVYVTATLPYLLIGAFLWRALTLPGASTGLRYLFSPRWGDLLKAEVWVNAAAQNFNSIGIAFGSLIAFSSYNKFNNNILIDTWTVSLTNSLTSLLAGLIVFATLGNIAEEQGKAVEDVVAEGPGLVFVVYPQAIAKMPFATLWAILFFFMLLILGLDSQFATVEVIITSLADGFPKQIKKYLRRHEVLVLLVCAVSLIFGLPNVTQGGIYFFQLIDYYAAAVSLMYLAFFEVVAIVWAYGAGRLARNVREMTGRYPSYYFLFCWYFAAPALILAIWIFSMVDYERPTYNDGEYNYPDWAIALGWVIASFSIAPIPIFAVIAVIKAKGSTFWEKLQASFQSQIEECPCCGKALNCLNEAHQRSQESLDKRDRLGSIELTTVPDNSKPNGVDLTIKENWNVNGFANGGEKVVMANNDAS